MNNPVKTKLTYDHDTDSIVSNRVQDVQPILELNKKEALGDSIYGPTNPASDMRKVASIPLVIIEKWKRELGVDVFNKDHMPKVKQLLNDPEYKWLRTHESNL
jgi:hypothetical protein